MCINAELSARLYKALRAGIRRIKREISNSKNMGVTRHDFK
jgi:hypothetical protein